MKKKALSIIITASVIGVLLGVLLLICGNEEIRKSVIRVFFIAVGAITIVANIPGFISGIININKKSGVFDLIMSILGIALGILLIFDLGTVVTVVVAVYLVVMPIVRICLAKDKKDQFKTEIPKIILGAIVAILSLDIVSAALNVIFTVAGIVVIVLSVAYCVIELVLLSKVKEEKIEGGVSVVYADTTGDGVIDTVIKDIDGDGTPDVIVNIENGDEEQK